MGRAGGYVPNLIQSSGRETSLSTAPRSWDVLVMKRSETWVKDGSQLRTLQLLIPSTGAGITIFPSTNWCLEWCLLLWKWHAPSRFCSFFEFLLGVQLSLVCNCIYMLDIYNSNLVKHPVCADTDLNAKFCVLQMTVKMCFRTLSLFWEFGPVQASPAGCQPHNSPLTRSSGTQPTGPRPVYFSFF